ncbi:MAG: hypothetical protein QG602_2408 [Verrucomicrobiota bacterium]|nr:hypothetical protein [Verrucomicrobiota bacterium]
MSEAYRHLFGGGFPAPSGGGGRGVGEKAANTMELRYYTPETWFTAEGAYLKARRLQRSGLPDMTNWRFVTLTVAVRNISREEAYLRGKDRLRRFFARFRAAIGREFKWCWKLEFHEDGYAHWHVLLEYTKQIPPEILPELEKWWGLGRVNVKRVKQRDLFYVFKYVAKGPDDLPAWVQNYRGRLRVFQGSRGFFVHAQRRTAKKQEPRSCLLPLTLGQRMEWDRRKAILAETNHRGEMFLSIVKLRMPFSELYLARVHQSVTKRQQLVGFGTVPISTSQAVEIKHEHKQYSGLGRIPRNAAAA